MTNLTANLTADEVRRWRAALGLSAAEAAELVGLNDGAAWRKWERNGVSGPAAVLLRAIIESRAVRRYFRLPGAPLTLVPDGRNVLRQRRRLGYV